MSEKSEAPLVIIGDETGNEFSMWLLSNYGGPHSYDSRYTRAQPETTDLDELFVNEFGSFDLHLEYKKGCNVHDELAGHYVYPSGHRRGNYDRGRPRAGVIFVTAEGDEGQPDLIFEIGKHKPPLRISYAVNVYEANGDDIKRIERVMASSWDHIPHSLRPGPLLEQDGFFRKFQERRHGAPEAADLSSYTIAKIDGLGVQSVEHILNHQTVASPGDIC